MYLANWVDARDRLYLNDGRGNFLDASAFLLPPWVNGITTGAHFADFDGDGDPDAVVRRYRTPPLFWLNTGGVFVEPPARFPVRARVLSDIAVGDLDGDGDLDLVMGDYSGPSEVAWNLYRQLDQLGVPRIE